MIRAYRDENWVEVRDSDGDLLLTFESEDPQGQMLSLDMLLTRIYADGFTAGQEAAKKRLDTLVDV